MSNIRLVCPRCGARYDVPPEVIPPEGRDVQCSHCAHTWFQAHPDAPAKPRPPAQSAPPARDDVRQSDDPQSDVRQDHANADPDSDPGADPDDEAPGPPPPPRALPPDVTEVFRQEREHEARQRARPDPFESQPDLGLQHPSDGDQARRARAARERMADPQDRDGDDAPDRAHPAAGGSRRDLLPDVEEISETLRGGDRTHGTARSPREAEHTTARGGGFARGFALVLTLGLLALAVYVTAPRIAGQVPATAPALDTYVTAVDAGRLWLHEQAAALRARLEDAAL